MNWNLLIYAGMAAFGAGMMTALVIFIEMKIPTVIRQLRSSSTRNGQYPGPGESVGKGRTARCGSSAEDGRSAKQDTSVKRGNLEKQDSSAESDDSAKSSSFVKRSKPVEIDSRSEKHRTAEQNKKIEENADEPFSAGRKTNEIDFIVTRRVVLSHMERRKNG